MHCHHIVEFPETLDHSEGDQLSDTPVHEHSGVTYPEKYNHTSYSVVQEAHDDTSCGG